ncbi:ribosome biogenesis GTPase Der [bacterium]|nr:ribosome biogenesis GTPase Der [bacterium]
MAIPVIAIIGRPNVGKSTLFNRILRRQVAIVDDTPGVTRDRNSYEFEWNGKKFMLVDTGGFIISSKDTMEQAVSEQSLLAIEESDVVLFLVDVNGGITDFDRAICEVLFRSGKPVILGVNKVDSNRQAYDIYEFYSLGIGDPYPVSGKTGRGTGDLLDAVIEKLPVNDKDWNDLVSPLRIAIIGRPNVGKSSIVNCLTGKKSVLVTDIPGTTRDSTDTHIKYRGRDIILVDTAGLKRVTKLKESLEYYSSLRTLRSLSRCDIAAVVLDISEGLLSYDKNLIDDVDKSGKGMIMVANKWDLVEKDHMTMKKIEAEIRNSLPDKDAFKMIFTSALTTQRVFNIIDNAIQIQDARTLRISTAEINRFTETFRFPPSAGDVSILYGTQYGIEPPSFVFFVSDVRKMKEHVTRYVERSLRKEYGFEGTPIKVTFKQRGKQ